MNPILIDLGIIQIRWYSLLILLGFIIGYFLIIDRVKKLGYSKSKITDLFFNLVIVAIIGARLYYCLFNFDYYSTHILDVFKVWEGGLAIHGGIIAGIVFLIVYRKKIELSLLQLFDIFVPALVLGQAIGRWGNFFNQEAYGPVVALKTLQNLHIPKFVIDGMYIQNSYHHPTFFYESIGCLIIFILIMILRNLKNIKSGQITGIYFILYGIIRFFIEGLRQDSLMLGSLKVAKLISIIMIFAGVILIIRPYMRRNNDK